MFNGVPLGSSGGIGSDSDVETKAIGQLRLQFGFPSSSPAIVAAARVGKNEQLARAGILGKSFMLPPMGNGMSGESRCVVRDANDDGAVVVDGLIDAIRDGDAQSIRSEVMIVDLAGRTIPTGPGVFEV